MVPARGRLEVRGMLSQRARKAMVLPIPMSPSAASWTWRQYQAVAATVLLAAALSFGAFAGLEARRPPSEFEDNFHSGLAQWQGGKTRTWSVDPSGFARPGELAIFGPSRTMGDFRLEFRAAVESKSLVLVYRAEDRNNYHAVRLRRGRPGALAIERFSVIGGKAEPATNLAAPVRNKAKTPFWITLVGAGTDFTLYADDVPVEQWSEIRLPRGGAGFIGEPGGRSRIYGIRLIDQSGLGERLQRLVAQAPAKATEDRKNAETGSRVGIR
jgi:hypothetical protein